jgi:hypothetical protein
MASSMALTLGLHSRPPPPFWWPEGVLARTNVTAAAERLTDPLSSDDPAASVVLLAQLPQFEGSHLGFPGT